LVSALAPITTAELNPADIQRRFGLLETPVKVYGGDLRYGINAAGIEFKRQGGIYGVICTATGQMYIGGAVDFDGRPKNYLNPSTIAKMNPQLREALA